MLNSYIDHTLLRPDSTGKEILRVCEEAKEYKFASACVAPCWIQVARPILANHSKLCVVKDFPHGNADEQNGNGTSLVDEIDYVANIGFIKSAKWEDVEWNLKAVRNGSYGKIVKYIVEVGYLTDEELYKMADLLIKHKIDFIKTCTGFGPRGVTVDDIKKIKGYVGDKILIKASGGIKTKTFAEDLIAAGANRIGTSSGVEIVK